MSLHWDNHYVNIVGKITSYYDYDCLEGNVFSKQQNCKQYDFDQIVVKLFKPSRSIVEVLNVKSIEHASEILLSIIPDVTINWKIVNTHKDIIMPTLLLDNILIYVKNNSRRRFVSETLTPTVGAKLKEFTHNVYSYTNGTFGIIFNIHHGIGKMSCRSEDYETKLQEFISIFSST